VGVECERVVQKGFTNREVVELVYLVHAAGELVAHDEAGWRGLVATEDVQFTTTESRVFDLDDNVQAMLDLGDRPVLDGYFVRAFEDDCFHSLVRHY